MPVRRDRHPNPIGREVGDQYGYDFHARPPWSGDPGEEGEILHQFHEAEIRREFVRGGPYFRECHVIMHRDLCPGNQVAPPGDETVAGGEVVMLVVEEQERDGRVPEMPELPVGIRQQPDIVKKPRACERQEQLGPRGGIDQR